MEKTSERIIEELEIQTEYAERKLKKETDELLEKVDEQIHTLEEIEKRDELGF